MLGANGIVLEALSLLLGVTQDLPGLLGECIKHFFLVHVFVTTYISRILLLFYLHGVRAKKVTLFSDSSHTVPFVPKACLIPFLEQKTGRSWRVMSSFVSMAPFMLSSRW